METISIIIPCYNEEEAIPVYYETMVRQMDEMEEQQKVQFELIFVDDGSKDHSLFEMRRLAQKDMRCRYLSFSRNFGKEAAMYAGLQAAKGDYVTVMDVDLQDPPSLLPKMYAMLQSGTCDCVAARRSSREGEGKIKSFLSNAFYGVINRLSRTEIVSGARDYRLMSRKMVDAVLEMSEYNRFSKGIFGWVGFHTEWLEFEHEDRCAGTSKWPLRKLLAYSVDGITGVVSAERDGYLITSIPYDENFVLKVDGKETLLFRANTAFLGAKIPSGEHKVVLVYHAPGRTAGSWCSLMGGMLALILVICEKKKQQNGSERAGESKMLQKQRKYYIIRV